MIVLVQERSALVLRRPSWWDRIRTRIGADALDRQLATGRSPLSSVSLALRADRLARPKRCRRLAEGLRRAEEAARRPAGGWSGVPVAAAPLAGARAELDALARRLTAPSPPGVRGLAIVSTLLHDGTGPLYRNSPNTSLRAELQRAREGLEAVW
jgi:hypothetical protein